tara:strand:+ start:318 stop:539 length:222 start_codon:yes stop_codon:yes gene_type:complete
VVILLDVDTDRLLRDLHPLDIDLTGAFLIVFAFLVMGLVFLMVEMTREYYWLQNIGGLDGAIFDIDDFDDGSS